MILSQALAAAISKGPTKCALRYLGKETLYLDLVKSVAKFSYMFQKEIGPNARVAFIGSNNPAFVCSFFALTNNRSIVIPIDPGSSDDDISEWIGDTHPTHIMVTTDLTNRIRDVLIRRGSNIPLIEIEKKHGGEYATSYVPPVGQTPTDKDPVLMLRTAGTAGKYKYCLFNHLQIQSVVMGLKKAYHVGPLDRFLTTLNWAHPFSFVHGMLFPVLSGSCCVIDHGLAQDEFLTFMLQAKVTRLVGFPPFFQKILQICRAFDRTLILKSITVSMGALDESVARGYEQMKVQVAQCYGQTENLWSISMSDTQEADRVQRGLTGFHYKVLDDNGDEIPGKERRRGQLAVTGGAAMMRYEPRNQKEEEAVKHLGQSVMRGTWLYTGDIFDLEGTADDVKLTFVGRKDGFHPVPKMLEGFDPVAIEKAVLKQEGITEVAAFQIGEGPIVCAVVLAQGCVLTQHQILATARPALTPKNIPSEVFFMPEFPHDQAGKPALAGIEKAYADSKEPDKKKAA